MILVIKSIAFCVNDTVCEVRSIQAPLKKKSGTTIIAGAKIDLINSSVNMPQAGFDPPRQ